MIVINTMKDIEAIKKQNRLPKPLINELEQYFKDIVTNLTGKEIFDKYDIKHYGSIFVMENTDNPNEIGIPRFVTIIEIGGTEYYKIVISKDDDSSIVVFSAANSFEAEFDKYISQFVID
ncbi:hypothetical protein [Clostridium sp.]|uniref:hypothetical protein n=1 Tax=Clostridium sp. TaxID=1506 RepID=UPI00262ACBEA|nr:hypothetical protein [Clostridium sp.]